MGQLDSLLVFSPPCTAPHLGAVADGARVDEDGVGAIKVVGHDVVRRLQHRRDDLRVAHVHLAPVGFNVRRARGKVIVRR
jgi:hypothetical protein